MTSGTQGRRTIATPRRRAVDTARKDELLDRVSDLLLDEGFTSITVEEIARRLHCSKSTLYGVAATKSQLVTAVTRRFFERATRDIEVEIAAIDGPAARIRAYLRGVGRAMSSQSPAFYQDMVSYEPTAQIYDVNSMAAARRVRELIQDGVDSGSFRDVDSDFASHLVAYAIDGIHSGHLQEMSGLTAGEAFSQLGDLVVTGLDKR